MSLPEAGYLKWDGIKYVLVPVIEVETGAAGPTGPTGAAGATGPTGAAGADYTETTYLATFTTGVDTYPISLTPTAEIQLGTNTSNLITVTVLATSYEDRISYQKVFTITYHPPSFEFANELMYPIDHVTDTDLLTPYDIFINNLGSGLIEVQVIGDSFLTTNFAVTVKVITATSLGIQLMF